jgi:hypothetical protein
MKYEVEKTSESQIKELIPISIQIKMRWRSITYRGFEYEATI